MNKIIKMAKMILLAFVVTIVSLTTAPLGILAEGEHIHDEDCVDFSDFVIEIDEETKYKVVVDLSSVLQETIQSVRQEQQGNIHITIVMGEQGDQFYVSAVEVVEMDAKYSSSESISPFWERMCCEAMDVRTFVMEFVWASGAVTTVTFRACVACGANWG